MKSVQKPVNFITIDLEEWFMANYDGVDFKKYINLGSRIDYQIDTLLRLFERNHVHATFFVVGEFARKYPAMIKEIYRQGHEIASHSFSHELIYNLTPKQFREDLRSSMDVLQYLTGNPVLGFRAPSWSVKADTLPWFYEILETEGIQYSSSVFPAKTFLYGIDGFPQHIHQPVINGQPFTIIEIPQPLFGLGKYRFGFAGGFYLRALPYFFIKQCISAHNRKGNPVFLYLHPREIDPKERRLELGLKERTIHYFGVGSCLQKFTRLIENGEYRYQRMDEHVKQLAMNNE